MQDLVRRVEHRAEELELLAQDLEREAPASVVLREEVDDGHVVLLAVAMAAADALLDALRVPRQVVVHDRVAELQVQALGAGLGGDEDARARLELVDERESRRDVGLELPAGVVWHSPRASARAPLARGGPRSCRRRA